MSFRKIDDARQLDMLDRLEGRRTFTTRVVAHKEEDFIWSLEHWYLPQSWPDLVGGAWLID